MTRRVLNMETNTITFKITTKCDADDVVKRIVSAVREKYDMYENVDGGVIFDDGEIIIEEADRYSYDGIDISVFGSCSTDIRFELDLSQCHRRVDAVTAFETAFDRVMSSLDIRDAPDVVLDETMKKIDTVIGRLRCVEEMMIKDADPHLDPTFTTIHTALSELTEIHEKGTRNSHE